MGSGAGSPQWPPGRQRTQLSKKLVLNTGRLFHHLLTRHVSTPFGVASATARRPVRPPTRRTGRSPNVREGEDFSAFHAERWTLINESNQANRVISTGKLHALPHFHTRPINVVVFHDSQGRTRFEVGFPLRCFQRLSRPYIATLLCRWRDNRSTRDTSIPVLSY